MTRKVGNYVILTAGGALSREGFETRDDADRAARLYLETKPGTTVWVAHVVDSISAPPAPTKSQKWKERDEKVLAMRAEGVTFRAMGDAIGLSMMGARRAYEDAQRRLSVPPSGVDNISVRSANAIMNALGVRGGVTIDHIRSFVALPDWRQSPNFGKRSAREIEEILERVDGSP